MPAEEPHIDLQRIAQRELAEALAMKSINFEFLRARCPELVVHAAFAEQHAQVDALACLARLRMFTETLVREMYLERRLPQPLSSNLNDLLIQPAFVSSVPRVVRDKLHLLRKKGNHAAHGGSSSTDVALRLVQEAYDLGKYLHVAVYEAPASDVPGYRSPPAPGQGKGELGRKQLQREKKELLQKLAAESERMKEALEQAERERQEREKLTDRLQRTEAELQAMQQSDLAQANFLGLSEEQTRKQFIDVELLEAGWDVTDPRRVGLEVEVKHQPTKTGLGAADYVLWDNNGKPLAVIEAKKSSKDADAGRTQARLYADGLQREWGQRPVIFYSNGYETWLWDDAQDEPPRRVFGYYSQDSLDRLHFQRRFRRPTSEVEVDRLIAGRSYQLETIRRVCERFDNKHRRALIVQATGTGKTRVAVALADVLLRSNVIKRVLFLCDRRELRKQARNAFREFLPGSNPTIATSGNIKAVGPQVLVATYPTMMKNFEHFDVGHFDLLIADESHRSIYSHYRDLFRYFDALQVGLTATPVHFIDRNTYDLFGCEDQDPTANYGLEEAIKDGNLVPPRVVEYQTQFQREGMRYADMSEEQRAQLEEYFADHEGVDYDREDLDRLVFNKDTNRRILRNLMENGIRVDEGARLGKTIIFARRHDHAVLLKQLFDEMYPAEGPSFCEVIDNYSTRAEQLIDDFKGDGKHNDIVIAVSVDMLDTGIDVREVVNLVFAKPVRSYVKFWQMVGRGTRLRENLFGPGEDKREFLIFDHWGNFAYFEKDYKPVPPAPSRSLQQRLFEARVALAEAYSHAMDIPSFERTVDLLLTDLRSIAAARSIEVKENLQALHQLTDRERLVAFEPVVRERLRQEAAPLMKWVKVRDVPAWRFDLLMAELQTAHAEGSSAYADLKGDVRNQVERLRTNLAQVRARADAIQRVRDDAFWTGATSADLEQLRLDLRDIMGLQQPTGPEPYRPLKVDITEDSTKTVTGVREVDNFGLEEVAYRRRVTEALQRLIPDSPTLQKIQRAEPVDEADIEELCKIVLSQTPNLDLKFLHRLYPETSGRLASAIRRVLGVDERTVTEVFETFIIEHGELTATQISFLRLLRRHILDHGGIEREKPYEEPFNRIHGDGLDGVFPDEAQAAAVLKLLERFFVDGSSSPPPAPQVA